MMLRLAKLSALRSCLNPIKDVFALFVFIISATSSVSKVGVVFLKASSTCCGFTPSFCACFKMLNVIESDACSVNPLPLKILSLNYYYQPQTSNALF